MNLHHPPTSLDLAGKRALVTGGTRGIGAVISRQLAAHGVHVFLGYYQDTGSAEQTLAAIHDQGGSASLVKANLVHPDEIRSMLDRIASSGSLDVLVHNAAIGSFKPTLDVRPNQWDLSMAVNARALLLLTQRALPLMSRGGRVVSVSSLGGSRVIPSYGAIGASKAALEALTRYLAAELAPRGITVNVVTAGPIDSPALRAHPDFEALASETRQRTPGGRLGQPEDVAQVVVLLCSPLADWVVGQTIVVDGGLSLFV